MSTLIWRCEKCNLKHFLEYEMGDVFIIIKEIHDKESPDCIFQPEEIKITWGITGDVKNDIEKTPYNEFKRDFLTLVKDENKGITLELSWIEAWSIFANLQLALKHPKNLGPTSEIARKIALKLQDKVAVTKALKDVAEESWEEDES